MKRLISYLLFLFSTFALNAQCTGGINGGALTPAPGPAFQTMPVSDGTYYTFVVPTGGCYTYTFSFCGPNGAATWDTEITILDNTGAAVAGAYDDDFCSFQSEITNWTPPSAGTYRVLINRWPCNVSGNMGTLAYQEQSTILGLHSQLGNARLGASPGCVVLTENSNSQRGCAWNPYNPLDFTAAFSYDFIVNLGTSNNGADGLTFVLQNDPNGICACGSHGGALGASGITNSLILEIDTYMNAEDRDDGVLMTTAGVTCGGGTEPDHLDIWLNGNINPVGGFCPGSPGARIIPSAVPLQNGGINYDIENGLDHTLRVSWATGTPGTLTASVMNLAATITYGTVSYSFDPLVVFGTNTPWYGFTSATGALSNQHSFCSPVILLDNENQEPEVVESLSFDLVIPNPIEVRASIRIEHSADAFKAYTLIDLKGNIIQKSPIPSGGNAEIKAPSTAGIYLLGLFGQDGVVVWSKVMVIN
ncbi:MAG: L-type lectin-domain containing protein [Bacteroidia bacterium]